MNYRIPFSGRSIKYNEAEVELVRKTLNDAEKLTQGKHLENFQDVFKKYLGVDNAFAVNSATSALELTAQLCQFVEGDEIISPAHTYTSSVYPFLKAGAKVVWADIDPDTHLITLEEIKKRRTENTKAILVVHLYGYMSPEMEEISKYAKSENLTLIEDVAQAIGTECSVTRKKAGSYGDFSIFSFHSHKNITTLGEGGMLVVKSPQIRDLIPLLRHNGHSGWNFPREDYWLPAMGNLSLPKLSGRVLMPNNYCIGEVECALGAKLLERLDEINNKKRTRAIAAIDQLSVGGHLKFHRVENRSHNYHLLVAEAREGLRDELIRKLSEQKSIQCVVQYYPLYRYDLYKTLGFGNADCPVTDKFFDNMISFPFNSHFSNEEVQYVIDSTLEILDKV